MSQMRELTQEEMALVAGGYDGALILKDVFIAGTAGAGIGATAGASTTFGLGTAIGTAIGAAVGSLFGLAAGLFGAKL